MINTSTLHPTPPGWDVMEAQVRAVGFAIRQLAIVAVLLMMIVTLFMIYLALRVNKGIPLFTEMTLVVALFAPLLAVAVWKGEYRFRHSYLASMPVTRGRHVLFKITAGWAWLMVLSVIFLLWMLMVAVVTGGEIGVLHGVLASDLPSGATPEEAAALAREWRVPGWTWVAFVLSATVPYLFGNAVVLASSRTRRWLAGIVVVVTFMLIADNQQFYLWGVSGATEKVLMIILEGRYGVETLISGSNSPDEVLKTAAGEQVPVWQYLVSFKQWLLTIVLWSGLAVASLAAVIGGDRKN